MANIHKSCCVPLVLRLSPGWRWDATVNQKSWPEPCAVLNGVDRGNVSMGMAPLSARPGAPALSRWIGVALGTGRAAQVVAFRLLATSLSQASVVSWPTGQVDWLK